MTTALTGQRKALFNEAQIRAAFATLVEVGQVVEVRALDARTADSPHYPYTASGYFTDLEALLRSLRSLRGAKGIYITLQPCQPELLARAHNRLRSSQQMKSDKATTTDAQIRRYRWLPIDADPNRPSGISSSEAEHQAALDVAATIRDALLAQGWPEPIQADSGNGAHLLYPLDLEVTPENTALISRVLQGLAERFGTAAVGIDLTVFNPARIWKLYGTLACKGDDTPERPHRLSRLLQVPDRGRDTLVSKEQLEAVAKAPEPPRTATPNPAVQGKLSSPVDFFHRHQIRFEEPPAKEGKTTYVLTDGCVFDPSHKGKDAAIIVRDGKWGYHCFHNSCSQKTWTDFRKHFEPNYAPSRRETQPSDGLTPEQIQAGLAAIEQALTDKDATAIFEQAETLAALPFKDFVLLKVRIKEVLGQKINLNDLEKVVNAARPVKTSSGEYEKTDAGMIQISGSDEQRIVLSNFAAEIVADVKTDDGAESSRSYAIAATIGGRQTRFEVPAKDFGKCEWVDEHLGARAWVTPGQTMKGHLVNAIKSCSEPEEVTHYGHTGWRKIDGVMVYLHAGGVIGEEARPGVSVHLTGPLAKYVFPDAPAPSIQEAIRASLRFTELASDTVTMPLYASLWRSVLGEVNYGVHLAGQTGWGKSELAAILQQHFGPAMTAYDLPGSWESTENSLEMLLFQAKDALLVVDDFKPKGSKADQDRLHAKADRVFRQIGNGSARGRLTSTLEQRPERRPRCLLLSTGEDIPRGQSLKARGVVVLMEERITAGEAAKKLSEAQKDARNGLYAQVMAAYLHWLAPRIQTLQGQLADLVAAEREKLNLDGHARSGTNTAQMILGMKCFLQFAQDTGAITEQEVATYLARCVAALEQIAREAARENTQEKPTEQWKRLIEAALASKRAHLTGPNGEFPGPQYGWVKSVRSVEREGVMVEDETFSGGGDQIGWIDGDHIYLLPSAAYKVARAMGSATADDMVTLEPTLRKFMVQEKLLASTDLGNARKTITVRRRLNGAQVNVLHLAKAVFYPNEDDDETPGEPSTAEVSPTPAPNAVRLVESASEQVVTEERTEPKNHESSPTVDTPKSALSSEMVKWKQRIEAWALARHYPSARLSDGTIISDGEKAWNDFLEWPDQKWQVAYEDICAGRIAIAATV
jgi:hypothetical protein